MPMIDRLNTIAEGATLDRLDATAERFVDVEVPPTIGRLLRKAGVTPPPVGQQLAVADVDAKFAAAGYDVGLRMELKQALVEKKLLAPGRPVGL